MSRHSGFLFLFFLLHAWGASWCVASDERVATHERPYLPVCVGYDPAEGAFSMAGVARRYDEGETTCPDGYAFLSSNSFARDHGPGRKIAIRGNCCPMPSDLLTDEHRWELEHCPANHVVTGARQEVPEDELSRNQGKALQWSPDYDNSLRCTKINTLRYRLGKPTTAAKLDHFMHFHESVVQKKLTTRAVMPSSIRYAPGRAAVLQWVNGPCVGIPFGSLMVGRTNKLCQNHFYVQVFLKAIRPGEPDVPLQPRPCLAIETPIDEYPTCIE